MAALFGFEELDIPAHGYRERPVEVVVLPFECSRLPIEPHPMAVKALAVWGHAGRNRLIGAVTKHIQDNAGAGVLEQFPALNAASAAMPASPRTIVLADNVQHGLALAEHLPGWPIVTGPNVPIASLPDDQVKLLHIANTMGQDKPVNAIVTIAGLDAVDLGAVDVVVRADGGPGLPPLDDKRLVQRCNEPPHRLLLVDLDDRHHRLLRQWSKNRLAAYRARGWHSPGADPVQMRIERFIAARPGGKRQ